MHIGLVGLGEMGGKMRSPLREVAIDASGYAEDPGEGRRTIEAATANAVSMPAIAGALFARFALRQDDSEAIKAVAAFCQQFGGHSVKEK